MDLVTAVKRRAADPKTQTDNVNVYLPKIGQMLSEREIVAIEQELCLEFPSTLRRLYTEVGDGGYGPGYGFLRMKKAPSKHDDTVVSLYKLFKAPDPPDPTWNWPEGLVLVSDWGCAIRTGVNCVSGKVVVFDPNLHDEDWSVAFLEQGCTLDEWLEKWCDGIDLWKEIYGAA